MASASASASLFSGLINEPGWMCWYGNVLTLFQDNVTSYNLRTNSDGSVVICGFVNNGRPQSVHLCTGFLHVYIAVLIKLKHMCHILTIGRMQSWIAGRNAYHVVHRAIHIYFFLQVVHHKATWVIETGRLKMQEVKMMDHKITRHENAKHKIAGHENRRHECTCSARMLVLNALILCSMFYWVCTYGPNVSLLLSLRLPG